MRHLTLPLASLLSHLLDCGVVVSAHTYARTQTPGVCLHARPAAVRQCSLCTCPVEASTQACRHFVAVPPRGHTLLSPSPLFLSEHYAGRGLLCPWPRPLACVVSVIALGGDCVPATHALWLVVMRRLLLGIAVLCAAARVVLPCTRCLRKAAGAIKGCVAARACVLGDGAGRGEEARPLVASPTVVAAAHKQGGG